MCTGTRIKHVYWGVQGACPRQAVTSAEGTAERQRVPCRRHGSKACAFKSIRLTYLQCTHYCQGINLTLPPPWWWPPILWAERWYESPNLWSCICSPQDYAFTATCWCIGTMLQFKQHPNVAKFTPGAGPKVAVLKDPGRAFPVGQSLAVLKWRYVADPALPTLIAHWPSQKRDKGHVKPPSPSYFINDICLYWPSGPMDSMSRTDCDRLSQSLCLNPGVCIIFVSL